MEDDITAASRDAQYAAAPLSPGADALPSSRSSASGDLRRSKMADHHHARGYAARKQGNFAQAIEEYNKALAVDPFHFKALFNRGFSFDKLGDHKRAIADYTAALQVGPRCSC